MILAIDIGNTRVKAAVFEKDIMLDFMRTEGRLARVYLKDFIKKRWGITDIVVSSVAGNGRWDDFLLETKLPVHRISHQSSFPFVNTYATPETLGIDRMVLSAGAVLQYPDTDRLVIDAGTCITYDFINASNHYLGGAISPGIRMRYESMNRFTAKLPLLPTGSPDHYIGDSTAASMHSGVICGIANEIDGFIETYKAQYPNIIIILTGGDTDFLAKRLKNTIFANSNFLLESLNSTFHYSITND